jgi:glutamate transport system substrate-binding protein
MSRGLGWLAVLASCALLGAGCGGDGSESSDARPAGSATTTAQAAPAAFPSGTTMAALQSRGKLVVGTKFDQPGFGLKGVSGKVEGFDVEIAKLIAAGIFGGTPQQAGEKIEFVEAVSKNREPFIKEGKVDLVVATYTINDARKMEVDFAGPYFVARQDIMVKRDNTSIKTVEDLNGKKVCSAQGSTSIKNLQAKAPTADTSIAFDTYSKCAEALRDGRVAAVSTDDTILAGLVKDSGGDFKLVGAPFSEEPYGIGLKKGDQVFRDFLNDRLEDIYQSGEWAAAFEATLGRLDLKTPAPPVVDRY